MDIGAYTADWEQVGETTNSRYYQIEPRIVAVVPHPKSQDTEATARENIDLQVQLLAAQGGGVVVIFVDNLTSQDKDARRVYEQRADPEVVLGSALVGGSLLGRAIGSFFLGLSRPRVELKLFASLEDALAWAHELIAPPGDGGQPAVR